MNHNVPMTEILPYLYLGNRSDANNVNRLIENGIGYILNLTTSATEYPQESKIISRQINILDFVCQCLKDTYQNAFDFIDETQKRNSKVLIHCEAGISRSPTITVAYLIYKNKMEALEAYNFVKKLRPIVSPNFGFMGQLMELENELMPERVALRLEKEAQLQKEACKLQEVRAKCEEVKEPLVEKIENRIQLSKPVRNAIKPSSLSLKRPLLPKPLSIDLTVLSTNSANKYISPSNPIYLPPLAQTETNHVESEEASDQNVNPNSNVGSIVKVSTETTNQPKTNLPSKCNQQSSSSSSKIVSSSTDCPKESQQMPNSNSQPQLTNSINQSNKNLIVDSNNNVSTTDAQCHIKQVKAKIDNVILKSNEQSDKSTDKLIDKPKVDKSVESTKVTKAEKLINTSQTYNLSQQPQPQLLNNSSQARSVPNSNACTPSTKQLTICALIPSSLIPQITQSKSQGSLFTLNSRSQVKPLRPSSLLLNGQQPTLKSKLKNNAITPSSLCSPLTAFASISSTKSSPTTLTFSGNLSSPFDTNEKMTKRRWLAETNCYQEFSQEFSPPECKKKTKQKKLKNISVEVN